MRADDDVDLARLETRDGGPLVLGRAKAAELGNIERKFGHALTEAMKMLLGENCCWHQHRDLVAAIDRFERGPHGDFGFAEAHVAAEQPIHGPRAEHVGFNRGDGGKLVGRFTVRKRSVELALPLAVEIERYARASPAEG